MAYPSLTYRMSGPPESRKRPNRRISEQERFDAVREAEMRQRGIAEIELAAIGSMFLVCPIDITGSKD